MKVEDLNLSVRASNALRRAGVHTMEQLMSMDSGDLLRIRNLGQKTLKEIQAVVKILEQKEREKVQKAGTRGSYMHGYQEGSEAMRRAVIRELTRMGRHKNNDDQKIVSEMCVAIREIEVL